MTRSQANMVHREGFYLWRCMPGGEVIKVGALALAQLSNGRIQDIQFKYDQDYLKNTHAIPLDPLNCPLIGVRQDYETAGRQLPGFIDDCLPDDWGRRIVAARLGVRHVDTLTLMTHLTGAAMGDVKIVPADRKAPPAWQGGVDYSTISAIADAVWKGDWDAMVAADQNLSLLLTGGSRTGGARPKLLVNDNGYEWLAKFNRSQDNFDMAAVEWACLKVVASAGFKVPEAVTDQLGPRRCLKVKRFDITPEGGRYHLLTFNALLKDPYSQDDPHLGSYEDIADIIRRYCEHPIADLEQLLGQLLINSALRNTDDHLRNFSLLHDGIGWHLSPAYDIVPDESMGAYHQITLSGKPFLPAIENAAETGKALGLGKAASQRVAVRVKEALAQWPGLLKQAGVDGAEYERLIKLQA